MKKKNRVLFLLFVAVVGLDALVKRFVDLRFDSLSLQGIPAVAGDIIVIDNWYGVKFYITRVTNLGMAWGLCSRWSEYIFYTRLLVIGALISYLVFVEERFSARLGLLFLLAGAVGNVLDYLIYGHVIDMFSLVFWGWHYPVFNLADFFIVLGALLLLIDYLRYKSIDISLE